MKTLCKLLTVLALALSALGVSALAALAAPPSNDTFAGATLIADGFSEELDTTEATTDGDDAQLNATCGFFSATDASVWYAFTGSDTMVVIDVSESDYPVGVLVGVGRQGNLETVACEPGTMAFFAAAGTTYYVLAIDFDGGGTRGLLRISFADPDDPAGESTDVRPSAERARSPLDSSGGPKGPKISRVVGPGGWISITSASIQATFFDTNTFIHASNAPECVMHIQDATLGWAAAGALTVGGSAIGLPLMSPVPIVVDAITNPDRNLGQTLNQYSNLRWRVYPRAEAGHTVTVEKAAFGVFPAIPLQTLHQGLPSASFVNPTVVQVITPAVPESGLLIIPNNKPYPLAWEVPAGTLPHHKLFIAFYQMFSDEKGPQIADLRCRYPLSAGRATVPKNLIKEFKRQLGRHLGGWIYVNVGDSTEVFDGKSSYVIELSAHPSSNLSGITDAVIE